MPLASVVLPLPNSAGSETITGGASEFAKARPPSLVSSGDAVMNWLATRLHLRGDAAAGERKNIGELPGQKGSGRARTRRGCIFSGQPVQKHPESEHPLPFRNPKLSRQAGENPCQYVARAAFRHPRISCCIDEDLALRRGDDCVKALEDDMNIPISRRLECRACAVCLHLVPFFPHTPRPSPRLCRPSPDSP